MTACNHCYFFFVFFIFNVRTKAVQVLVYRLLYEHRGFVLSRERKSTRARVRKTDKTKHNAAHAYRN